MRSSAKARALVIRPSGFTPATVQIDHADNSEHAGRDSFPRSGAIRHPAVSAPEQLDDSGSEEYRGKDAKHDYLSPDRGAAPVHLVFAHGPPSVAGSGHFHASDSPPRGLVGQSLGPHVTAGEHEEIANQDAGRQAQQVVKMDEVDDPGDDQGKAAEEGHSAKAPEDEAANEHHGAIGALPGSLFVFGHVTELSAERDVSLKARAPVCQVA